MDKPHTVTQRRHEQSAGGHLSEKPHRRRSNFLVATDRFHWLFCFELLLTFGSFSLVFDSLERLYPFTRFARLKDRLLAEDNLHSESLKSGQRCIDRSNAP